MHHLTQQDLSTIEPSDGTMPFRTTLVEIKRAVLERKIMQLNVAPTPEMTSNDRANTISNHLQVIDDLQALFEATAVRSYMQQKQVGAGALCYVMPKNVKVDGSDIHAFSSVQPHTKAVVSVDCTCCFPFQLTPFHVNQPDGLVIAKEHNYVLDVNQDTLVPIGQIRSVFWSAYTFHLFYKYCDFGYIGKIISRVPQGDNLIRHLIQVWLAKFTFMAKKDGHVIMPWDDTYHVFGF